MQSIRDLLRETEGKRFTTLLWGEFSQGQIVCEEQLPENNALYSPERLRSIEEKIASAKATASLHGRNFHNDPLFRLARISQSSPVPALHLGLTTYFEYAGTRGEMQPEEMRADPIGTGIILITSDGFVPIGTRSKAVEVNGGRLFSFGGFFDPVLDLDPKGSPDLFHCFARELEEELGIEVRVDELICLGIMYDHLYSHPEAIALATLSQVDSQLIANSNWHEELEDIQFVALPELPEFVLRRQENISEGLLGGLLRFLLSPRYSRLCSELTTA